MKHRTADPSRSPLASQALQGPTGAGYKVGGSQCQAGEGMGHEKGQRTCPVPWHAYVRFNPSLTAAGTTGTSLYLFSLPSLPEPAPAPCPPGRPGP